jgi:hypothetical protein
MRANMLQMKVTLELFVDVEVDTHEEAEEFLRNTEDAELWEIAKKITYEYDIIE